jgi:tryptophan synthase beta subunit
MEKQDKAQLVRPKDNGSYVVVVQVQEKNFQQKQDDDGNIKLAHSISAGLDYPGVGPEHAYLRDTKRVEYVSIRDDECMNALMELNKLEGILPAIESAHALAHALKIAQNEMKGKTIIVCLSGRGDKDIDTISKYFNGEETNK